MGIRSVARAARMFAGCLLFGCTAGPVTPIEVTTSEPCDPSGYVSLACSTERTVRALPPGCTDCAALDGPALSEALAQTTNLTAETLPLRYPMPLVGSLGYDPRTAANLERLAQSTLKLDETELETLHRNGFVISNGYRFGTFAYGYADIFQADLPVFVSADSIMHAVHKSYDRILSSIEEKYLAAELEQLLDGLHARLQAGAAAGFPTAAIADADVYLTTAKSLLKDTLQAPLAGGDPATVTQLFEQARAAAGLSTVNLFGADADIDFSQFQPRGHYTRSELLKRYFRSTIWLGRIEMRLTPPGVNPPVLQRRALEAATLLTFLHDSPTTQHRMNIDAVIRLFVGEPDDMTPEQLTSILSRLGVMTATELAARSDTELLQAILTSHSGVQRIASQILEGGLGQTTPLPRSFLLLGQRYVADSHVFSNLVYDRVGGGTIRRLMPSPLDVAFAALRNNQAATLLRRELAHHPYAPDLAAMRVLLDGHGESYWQSNLYNAWLGALRTLSPDETTRTPATYGLPAISGTEAWGRRLLNTQLASWAELRHDTVLYVKQSAGDSIACEFPDAFVDPYPRFFEAVATLGERGTAGLRALPGTSAVPILEQAAQYFEHLSQVARMLQEMAEFQRAQRRFTDTHMAFVNELVRIGRGCGYAQTPGWYLGLFWEPSDARGFASTIVDVHTDGENQRVLHAATGTPRLMVMTAETCQGVRAYVGLASSYFEVTTGGLKRLTDEEWEKQLLTTPPVDVPWLHDILGQGGRL